MKSSRLFWICLLILVLLPFSVKIKAAELPDTVWVLKQDILYCDTLPMASNSDPANWIECDTVWTQKAIPTRQIIEDWMEIYTDAIYGRYFPGGFVGDSMLISIDDVLDWHSTLDYYLKHKGGVVKDD